MVTLQYQEGEPPVGFSFVTMNELPYKPMLWFVRAVKCGNTKPFMLTLLNGMYILWVLKPKGVDKMVGVGW